MKKSLNDWLIQLESIHPLSMDFKLERILEVFKNLNLGKIAPLIVTVAGTNGKGSTATTTAAIFQALGANVGLYTSPHIHLFNERIAINQVVASDYELIEAFEHIDHIRGDITLTYFEYATLAAFYLFKKHAVDVAVFEVGLGGRLDATNIVDADIAIITPIDIDHTAQLGNTIDEIAREKAGIIKQNAISIASERTPSRAIIDQAKRKDAPLFYLDNGYSYSSHEGENHWSFSSNGVNLRLNAPRLKGDHQYQNAAASIMAVLASPYKESVTEEIVNNALDSVRLKGRFERYNYPPLQTFYFDVAHNPQGAKILANELTKLKDQKTGRKIVAVLGILGDKEALKVVTILNDLIDHWILATLKSERGQTALELYNKVNGVITEVITANNIGEGCEKALSITHKNDIILVFGSFHTVSDGLNWIDKRINDE